MPDNRVRDSLLVLMHEMSYRTKLELIISSISTSNSRELLGQI